MKLNIYILLVLTALCAFSCQKQKENTTENTYFSLADTGIQTGGVKMIPLQVGEKTYKIWTKRIGNNPNVKVLLLNGGPGLTHEYFECFENFLPAAGIEFIYYDQLGCGNSDASQDTSLWQLARYVEEVEQVRKALNLNKDNFYLLGHSWGGILALDYALKYQDNLKGLIISNMMCSAPEYGRYAQEVLSKQMPVAVLDSIRDIEKRKDFSNPRYMGLLMPHFYNQHICRIPLADWPEPINRSMAKVNNTIYVSMQGPSEFGISGKLEKWDRSKDLSQIKVPTLTIGAKFDTMDPEHMKWMSTQVQKGTFLYCEKGSHICFYDDQQTYFKGLLAFLK